MTDRTVSDSGSLPDHECREWSDECDGPVQWQADGAKRCLLHQRRHERTRSRQRLVSATVAITVVATLGFIANALIGTEEGPSQARAWEVCEAHAVDNLDLPAGALFADLPINPSDRVKLQLGSNRYDVYSYYEAPNADRQDFRCTVAYLGADDWQVVHLVTRTD